MSSNNVQKQPWWATPSFTCTLCTLLFLGRKSVTEVEDFKLKAGLLRKTDTGNSPGCIINNFRADKIKISNEEVSKL